MKYRLLQSASPAPYTPQRQDLRLLACLCALMTCVAVGPPTSAAGKPGARGELTPVSTSAQGQPAPQFHVKAWINPQGRSTPPAVQGKVQLVVFWATYCPGCVRKLPELKATADRLATSDVVIIGLHASRASAAQVESFVRARNLNYAIAIDESPASRTSFGATAEAFGVHRIPQAAVIDRNGHLHFVGPYEQALHQAEALLGPTSG